MPTLEHSLTEEQKAQFDRDGFLVVRQMFSPSEIAEIRDTFMAQNANGPVPGLSDTKLTAGSRPTTRWRSTRA